MNSNAEQREPATVFFGRSVIALPLSQPQQDAVDFLEECALAFRPLAALVGIAGSGKTVALNAAMIRLEAAGRRIVRIRNFVAGPLHLHRAIATALGIERAGDLSADEIDAALRNVLKAEVDTAPPVIAVDDAQSLLPEALVYLCTLSGLRQAGRPRFCVLLCGREIGDSQAIPLIFELEAVQLQEATRLVPHTSSAAGTRAFDQIARDPAEAADENFRTLDYVAGRRIGTGPQEPQADERDAARPDARRGALRWLALGCCLLLGSASGALTFHYTHQASPLRPPPKEPEPVPVPAIAPPIIEAPPSLAPPPQPKEIPTLAAPGLPADQTVPQPGALISLPGFELPGKLIASSPPPVLPTYIISRNPDLSWNIVDRQTRKPITADVDLDALHLDLKARLALLAGDEQLVVSGSVRGEGSQDRTLQVRAVLARRHIHTPRSPVPATSPETTPAPAMTPPVQASSPAPAPASDTGSCDWLCQSNMQQSAGAQPTPRKQFAPANKIEMKSDIQPEKASPTAAVQAASPRKQTAPPGATLPRAQGDEDNWLSDSASNPDAQAADRKSPVPAAPPQAQ
nr:ATP-binding protein [uncultured Lichenicoccus sp.]